MLDNKIKQIEELAKDYTLLMQQDKELKNKNRYRGVVQGLNLALGILKEQGKIKEDYEESIKQFICPVCGLTVAQMFYPVVQIGEEVFHVECYDKAVID